MISQKKRASFCALAAAAAVAVASQQVSAQTIGTWKPGQTGNWATAGASGWTNGVVPNAIGDSATYTSDGAGVTSPTVTISSGAGVTLGTLSISGSNDRSWIITPTGGITFNQDGGGPGFAQILETQNAAQDLNASPQIPANEMVRLAAGTITLNDDLHITNSGTSRRTSGSIQIQAIIAGTGNITINNASNDPAHGQIALSVNGTASQSTFGGNTNIESGAVTFTRGDRFTPTATNVITLGKAGGGSATLVQDGIGAGFTMENTFVVAANTGGTTVFGAVGQPVTGTFSPTGSVAVKSTPGFPLATVTLNGDLSLTSSLIDGSAGEKNVEINNWITGPGAITKIGAGNALLSGNHANGDSRVNDFTGGTKVNAGTLRLSGNSPLGATSNTLQVNNVNTGATPTATLLRMNADQATTTGSLSGTITTPGVGNTATINLNGQPLTVNQTTAGTYQGTITGAGGFTLGSGSTATLNLTGTNDYTGGTNVQAAKLQVNRLHENNAVSISGGGTLQVRDSSPTFPSHPAGNNAFVSRPGSTPTIANDGAPFQSRVYHGTLDLGNNDLIVDYSDPFNSPRASIEDMVRSGFNFGDWFGTGITSSAASSDFAGGLYALGVADNSDLIVPFGDGTSGPLFDGQIVDDTTVLVKFTHRADIDLDGVITSNDAAVFNGQYTEGAAAHWATGDLDYDGLYSSNDAAFFNGFYDESLQSLPEPGSLALLGTLGVGLLRRRRHV